MSDPLDVRRLAEAVSASELIEAAEEGGVTRRPRSPRSRSRRTRAVAAERLAKLAEGGRDRSRVLAAILGGRGFSPGRSASSSTRAASARAPRR